jgi:hypothetical protein
MDEDIIPQFPENCKSKRMNLQGCGTFLTKQYTCDIMKEKDHPGDLMKGTKR